MANQCNMFQLVGRLTTDVKTFNNSDGSIKVRFTMACKDNYPSKNRSGNSGYQSQFLPVEALLTAESVKRNGLGIYASMHKGDLVGVIGQIKNNSFVDKKTGETQYQLVLQIESRVLLEPKAVTDARLANNAAAADNADDEANG